MDPNGKVVVVTGATSGLGQAFAIDAGKKGAHVVVVGRNEQRAQETLDEITKAGGKADVVLGDVATIEGARDVARQILEKSPHVDVLVNNAGGKFDSMSTTKDGVETTFALNALGAWVLERELHAALAEANGRVVNVATGFLDRYPVDADDLANPEKFSSLGQYARAKQAVVMMTVQQAERYEGDGVSVVSLHPGIILGTRFGGGGPPKALHWIIRPILRALGPGCTLEEATRRFGVAAFGDVPTGSYIVNGEPADLPKQVKDPAVREKVVGLIERLASA